MHGHWLPEEDRWIAAVGSGCKVRDFDWAKRARIFSANFSPANTRDVSSRYHKDVKKTAPAQALHRFLHTGHPDWPFEPEYAEYIWEATQILNTFTPEWRVEIPQDRMSDVEVKALLGIGTATAMAPATEAETGIETAARIGGNDTSGQQPAIVEWTQIEDEYVVILAIGRTDEWKERQRWFDLNISPNQRKDIRARWETRLRDSDEANALRSYFYGEPRFHVEARFIGLIERTENLLWSFPRETRIETSKDVNAQALGMVGCSAFPF